MSPITPIILSFNIRRMMYQSIGIKLFQHIPNLYGIHLLPIITNPNDGIEQRANQINKKLPRLLESLKSQKVHIVSYSLSGIDCRYALSQLAIKQYCHTLTTICSPHLGAKSALLSEKKIFGSDTMDGVSRLLGVSIKCFHELVPQNMSNFNKYITNIDNIDYYSIGAERLPNNCHENLRELGTYLRLKTEHNYIYQNDGIFGHDEIIWGEHLVNLQADHSEVIGLGEKILQKQKKNKNYSNCFNIVLENVEDWEEESIALQ